MKRAFYVAASAMMTRGIAQAVNIVAVGPPKDARGVTSWAHKAWATVGTSGWVERCVAHTLTVTVATARAVRGIAISTCPARLAEAATCDGKA